MRKCDISTTTDKPKQTSAIEVLDSKKKRGRKEGKLCIRWALYCLV